MLPSNSLTARSLSAASLQYGATPGSWSLFWLPLLIVGLVVLVTSSDFQYAALGGAEVYGELVGTSRSRQVSFLLLGGMGALYLLRPSARGKVPFWPLILPAIVLMAYVYLSAFWSDNPLQTIKRVVLLTCIVSAGFGMGKHWSYRQFNLAMLVLSGTFLAVSILVELHYRAFLLTGGEYRFCGMFHPARQAFNCGMLALASLSFYFTAGRQKRFLLLTAVALAFVVLTKARTGFAATCIACAVLTWPYLSRKLLIKSSILAAWLAAAFLAYSGATGMEFDAKRLTTMGRDTEVADPTELTGRLPIWNQAFESFQQRPVVGHGYGAFWTDHRLADFERRNGWALAHSHSANLELLLNIGLIGAGLVWLIAVVAFLRSIRLAAIPSSAPARLVTALLVMALVSSFTEIAFISDGNEFLLLLTGIGVLAFQPAVHGQSRRRSGVEVQT